MSGSYDDTQLYYVPPAGAQHTWGVPQPEADTIADGWDPVGDGWDPVEELAQILSGASAAYAASATSAASPAPEADAEAAGESPAVPRRHRTGRRREGEDSHFLDGGHRVTHVSALIAVIALGALAMLGWSISYSYGQLRAVAATVLPPEFAPWWPLTVYGPWLVAALSVLRATVQQRSARRSWGIILVASAMAVALCVSHSSRSPLALVITGIPPLTALACFWELVGQVGAGVKHRPRHAVPGEAAIAAERSGRPHRAPVR